MSTLLEDITKSIKEGITAVADKTDELTKIGRLKVEASAIKRNIEKSFTQLGGHVYHIITVASVSNVTKDSEVKRLVGEIAELEKKLHEKNDEIETVKKTKEAERRQRAEAKKREKEQAAKVEVATVEKSEESKPEPVEFQEIAADKPKKSKKK